MTVVVVALLLTWGLATATAVPVEEGLTLAPRAAHAVTGSGQSEAGPLLSATHTVDLNGTAAPVSQIEAMLGAVVSATLSQYVADLSGEWPVLIGGEAYTLTTRHTYSGEPIERAAEYVGEHLTGLGLAVEYHNWQVDGPPNVIGELEGELYPEEVVILSAHLDSTTGENPQLIAPGADDNASGVAAVLVAAEILSQFSWGRTVRFALWTGEEQRLLGSHAYAQRSSSLGEEIVAVVNLDMIGWDAVGGPDMDLHAKEALVPGSLRLAELFSGVVETYHLNLLPEIHADGMGRSDHVSFWTVGVPAILAIEDYYPSGHDFNPYYHTDEDRLEHLDLDFFTEFAKAAVGTVAHLGCLVENGPCRWRLYLPLVVRSR